MSGKRPRRELLKVPQEDEDDRPCPPPGQNGHHEHVDSPPDGFVADDVIDDANGGVGVGLSASFSDHSSMPSENGDVAHYRWSPSGSSWRDMLFFVGPGFMVCIAYGK